MTDFVGFIKKHKTKIITVGVAAATVLVPELSFADGIGGLGAGETAVTDSKLGNMIDSAIALLSDIDTKTVDVFKPFFGAAATTMGARFMYHRVIK